MATACFAQSFAQEKSIEESYLQESVETMIIREQASSSDREGKLIALDYISEALENGKSDDNLRIILEGLAMEGILDKTRYEGRVTNNFPDVRMRAAQYLGEIGTKEANDALIKLVLTEEEPAVLTEAVRSLTKIKNAEESKRTLASINFIFNQFNAMNPDNRFALSVVDAVEALSTVSEIKDQGVFECVRQISTNHNYLTPVRERAKAVLATLVKRNSGK
jgi:HEAT repeat protein